MYMSNSNISIRVPAEDIALYKKCEDLVAEKFEYFWNDIEDRISFKNLSVEEISKKKYRIKSAWTHILRIQLFTILKYKNIDRNQPELIKNELDLVFHLPLRFINIIKNVFNEKEILLQFLNAAQSMGNISNTKREKRSPNEKERIWDILNDEWFEFDSKGKGGKYDFFKHVEKNSKKILGKKQTFGQIKGLWYRLENKYKGKIY